MHPHLATHKRALRLFPSQGSAKLKSRAATMKLILRHGGRR